MHRHRRVIIAAALIGSLSFAACTEEDRTDLSNSASSLLDQAGTVVQNVTDDVAEAAVRTFATQQGEEQFANADHPLDPSGLSCEATVADGADQVDVNCTGTTEAGGAAVLTGTTSELPGASITELKGSFTGTVDGTEVFTTDRLGG